MGGGPTGGRVVGSARRAVVLVVAVSLALGAVACGTSRTESTGVVTNTTAQPSTTTTPAGPGSTSSVGVPDGEPDFSGTVNSVDPLPKTAECTPGWNDPASDPDGATSSDDPMRCPPDTNVLGTVLIGDEISLTVTAATRLRGCGPTDEIVALSFAELREMVGAEARAWVSGPVAESYPMQATADVISIAACG